MEESVFLSMWHILWIGWKFVWATVMASASSTWSYYWSLFGQITVSKLWSWSYMESDSGRK